MSTTHTTSTTTFDVGALRRAYAEGDPAALLRLYAEDAEIELVDARNTPSRPLRLRGREAIRAHFEDVLARDMIARRRPRRRPTAKARRTACAAATRTVSGFSAPPPPRCATAGSSPRSGVQAWDDVAG